MVDLATPTERIVSPSDPEALVERHQADLFVPASTPGVAPLLRDVALQMSVVAEPDLSVDAVRSELSGIAGRLSVHPSHDANYYYYFVDGLRAMIWAIGAVVLSVGLLAFAISALDRALNRGREIVGLQLLGTPRRTLRSTQWLESLLPMAIGLGWWTGTGFLSFGGESSVTPWRSAAGLTAVSLAAAVAIAALTVVASAPRSRPELIRRE